MIESFQPSSLLKLGGINIFENIKTLIYRNIDYIIYTFNNFS